ncbi:MAG: AMP-binding protein [Gammaproteobacteria bacterium]|nr:AMP-binding protein [Gammaproteobacteria bacterium]
MDTREFETLQALAVALHEGGSAPALTAFGAHDAEALDAQALAGRVKATAGALAARGVSPGEPVALFAANSAAWVIAALALMRQGAVLVPLDAQLAGEPLAHVLGDCGARQVLADAARAETLASLDLEPAPEVLDLDALAGAEAAEVPDAEADTNADGNVDGNGNGRAADASGDIDRDARAVIFYTSGTTGKPKGVPLTHRNLTANVNAILAQGIIHARDRALVPLPFHHVYPFTAGLLATLQQGAAIVLPYSLVGPQLVRALREGEASVLLGVPRLYDSLVQAIEQRAAGRGRIAAGLFRGLLGLSRGLRRLGLRRPGRWLLGSLHRRMAPQLRLVVSGGAALPAALANRLLDLGWEVATGYGLTETSPILTFNAPGEGDLASAGRALPGVSLRTREPANPEHPAEVEASGPNVFAGYLNLPERSEEAFSDDGWFRTGDIGWIDDHGYLHLAGRASDMIVMPGGENVDPEKIEDALKAQQDIEDACVFEAEGRLLALLQPAMTALREHEDADGLREQLRRAVTAAGRELPSHHRLDDFRITPDPLPRTRLGKLRRHEAEATYQQTGRDDTDVAAEPIAIERMSPEDQQLLQIPTARAVWDSLCERFSDRRLTPDSSPQLDLGLDSLGWVSLTLALREEAGVDLPETSASGWESVRDLLRDAADASPAEAGGDLVTLLREPESLLDADSRRWLAPSGGFRRGLLGVAHRLLQAFCRWRFTLRVEGAANLPGTGPYLLAPRHLSALDPLVVAAALSREDALALRWAGWTGILFRGRLRRGASRLAGVLPIDPATAPRTSLALGAATLARNYPLVWFPEGRRSPDGSLQPLRSGVGLLLAAQPVPVIPVWLEGTREVLPAGRLWPRRGPVSVRFGEPLDPAKLADSGEGEGEAERIATALGEALARLGACDNTA